jgi:protoheme IX farnesyltransferase
MPSKEASPSIKDLLALCKLKVVSLILLTAVVGMLLAVPYVPNLLLIVIASIGISLSAMSAAVFNHIIDEKTDVQMSRTDRRPLPKGKVTRNQALVWGLFLGLVGIALLFFFVNALTAVLTFLSLIGYAVFYTMYLKHATPQNIVIGGAAGAAPPVLGWTSVAGSQGIEYALLLFLIVFIWTPPHFWALALKTKVEYKLVNIPMLPNIKGDKSTKWHIFFYSLILVIFSTLPYFFDFLSL